VHWINLITRILHEAHDLEEATDKPVTKPNL